MSSLLDQNLVVVGSVTVASAFVLGSVLGVLAKFYRRCGADEALVRTGAGGNKVVIGGGVTVYPILHQLQRVSLRSMKLSVERSGKNALVTGDKIKANVTTELYIKVEPIAEDVLAAARSFGERNLSEQAVGDLIEGKLTDALRSVAANQTFMDLHANRKEFAEHIQRALAEELKKNGLTLENVSITALAMVPVRELDEHDVFDAAGLRAITESVQNDREKTNRIQREKENLIQAQNVEARMRALSLEETQKHAEADQARKVAEYAATQRAETDKALYVQEQARDLAAYDKQRAVETARIQQEQAIAMAAAEKLRAEREAMIAVEKAQMAAEIAKQREIEAAQIEKEKVVQTAEIDRQKVIEASAIDKERAVEVARIGKVIAITQSEEEQARAAAAKALALAEEERARQEIVTVEETAKAEREKSIAVIDAQAKAEVQRALAQAEAERRRIEAQSKADAAEKEAEAARLLAEAIAKRGEAEAKVKRAQVEAENALALKFVLRDVAKEALRVAPDVARELMAPARAISEIKVLQTSGAGSAGSPGPLGAASPIFKTILEAGAAYPLVRSLVEFAQKDPVIGNQARALLGGLGTELESLKSEAGVKVEASNPAPAEEPPKLAAE
jgi:uncharacterized membrane protein YqiK